MLNKKTFLSLQVIRFILYMELENLLKTRNIIDNCKISSLKIKLCFFLYANFGTLLKFLQSLLVTSFADPKRYRTLHLVLAHSSQMNFQGSQNLRKLLL